MLENDSKLNQDFDHNNPKKFITTNHKLKSSSSNHNHHHHHHHHHNHHNQPSANKHTDPKQQQQNHHQQPDTKLLINISNSNNHLPNKQQPPTTPPIIGSNSNTISNELSTALKLNQSSNNKQASAPPINSLMYSFVTFEGNKTKYIYIPIKKVAQLFFIGQDNYNYYLTIKNDNRFLISHTQKYS